MKKSQRRKLKQAALDASGAEINNPKPLFIGTSKQSRKRLQRFIEKDLQAYASLHGLESEEEANDFDIEDDEAEMNLSRFQVELMGEEYLKPLNDTDISPPHPKDGGEKSEPEPEAPEPSKDTDIDST